MPGIRHVSLPRRKLKPFGCPTKAPRTGLEWSRPGREIAVSVLPAQGTFVDGALCERSLAISREKSNPFQDPFVDMAACFGASEAPLMPARMAGPQSREGTSHQAPGLKSGLRFPLRVRR